MHCLSDALVGDSFVTTVYEMVRKSDAACIAAILYPDDSNTDAQSPNPSSVRWIAGLLDALAKVSPDLGGAFRNPLDPMSARGMLGLRGLSWPKALGLRVIMPSEVGGREWHGQAAKVISHISHGL